MTIVYDHVSQPQGFPVPNPTESYWQAKPHRLASYRSSDTVPEHADIVIIGTGLAGVATAYHILKACADVQEKPKVVLLEARHACSGATGRNGGHTKIAITSIKRFFDQEGPEHVAAMIAHQAAQMYALKETVEHEGIDCEFALRRSFDVFFDAGYANEVKKWLVEQQASGQSWTRDLQWVDGEYMERITGVKGIKGAASVPAASLWPYKFVTELLAKVLDLGGLLYTETLVQSVTPPSTNDSLNTIQTSRGTLKAAKVIFATNGYSAALLPQYQQVITPVKGQASHLVAQAAGHSDLNLFATYNLHYDGGTADYLIPQPDGAILLGGAQAHFRDDRALWYDVVDDSTLLTGAATEHFEELMERRFRGWEKSEVKADYVWSGIMGRTPDGKPHVGRVPGTRVQWILAGFNGGGMSLIFTLTRGLARMVLDGADYEDTGMLPVFKTTGERLRAARGEA